ncbi:MAG: biopolymer transporter ExbD [Burkholderiaceae bacterium]|nr:biopolymer transporter ExbD [Burkholderiaceae bacterium]MDO9089651.1 biopolymer transporter ExbD [Burkholderiaceae bacterium]MDP1967913.1 biopolymer transporter ExbD [Burkholderiaceae bacterium]
MALNYKRLPGDEDGLISQINTTPLVDVMLVLLIIFLITIPVVSSSVVLQLPRESSRAEQSEPGKVIVSVDASGVLYWFDTPLPDTQALMVRLGRVATAVPQPEVHIRGDARASYEAIGRVVFACQQLGISRIGFITEPPRRD